jgi:hypothetical protein
MTTANGLPDLLPILHALPRADKLRLIEFLAGELVREEGIEPGVSYPLWTPHHAFDAAAVLLRELENEGPAP